MNKIIRIITLSLALVTATSVFSTSYCVDLPQKKQIKIFEGRVTYISWVASKVTVSGVGLMEFYVPKDTPITKLGSQIWLSNINILDNLIVEYYIDPSGVSTAVKVTVTVV